MNVLPNVVYIGPDKAGSTWIFRLFRLHADIFVTPAKDLYFFDRYYQRGLGWYARQFAGGAAHKIVAEISHDYLYSRTAAERLSNVLSGVKLVVSLREPCERTFSAYLQLVKGGHFQGPFEEAIEKYPGLIHRSLYGKHLAAYLEHFSPGQVHLARFELLQRDPQRFADQLLQALGVPAIALPPSHRANALPAGRSRSVLLTKAVKRTADLVRSAGMPKVVGRVKTSRLAQTILYARYAQEVKPRISAATRARLRSLFAPDVTLLDNTFGTNFAELWAYGESVGETIGA